MVGRIPACLRDGLVVAIEQLERKAGERYGTAGLSIALYDLEMCR